LRFFERTNPREPGGPAGGVSEPGVFGCVDGVFDSFGEAVFTGTGVDGANSNCVCFSFHDLDPCFDPSGVLDEAAAGCGLAAGPRGP